MVFFDSHNHLQDDRLKPYLKEITSSIPFCSIHKMVVNGSCEEDWPDVLNLAKAYPFVIPSFGYHPWYIHERTPSWRENLKHYLEAIPSAVGEIGLDRWIENFDLPAQEEVFLYQLQVAAECNLPSSIHCLKAWGRLYDLLRDNPRPDRGFLLHSYGGPEEMIAPLAKLGAYFSFPGYFLHQRKERQRNTFSSVPLDRLLVETDAPDQMPPENATSCPLPLDASGKPLNHPCNLPAIYAGLAAALKVDPLTLNDTIAENFHRLFLNQ